MTPALRNTCILTVEANSELDYMEACYKSMLLYLLFTTYYLHYGQHRQEQRVGIYKHKLGLKEQNFRGCFLQKAKNCKTD